MCAYILIYFPIFLQVLSYSQEFKMKVFHFQDIYKMGDAYITSW